MNDDLKAYVDGELAPDAAERMRVTLDADPALRWDAEALRALGVALRSLPEPESVGRSATLAALASRRPLWREWTPALAGCAALLLVAAGIQTRRGGAWTQAAISGPVVSIRGEATLPEARRVAFVQYVRSLGGEVRRDGDGLRAFYPPAAHEEVKHRFLLPDDLPWPTDGLRVRLTP